MNFGINKIENFVYKNNIFDRGSCMLVMLVADNKGNFPEFYGNTFAQDNGKKILEKQGQIHNVGWNPQKVITDVIGDKTGKFIKY